MVAQIPGAGRTTRREPRPWLKPGLFLGSMAPLAYLILRASQADLGANPIAQIENSLGLTALIFLVTTTACSPARRLLGWTWAMHVRRQLGLWAFFYASLHFLTYLVIDQFFDWQAIVEDVTERPFISVGFAALVLLVPLAVTSTTGWIRRMGYKRWLRLHQLLYLAVILAALHFFWRVKIDVNQPLVYAAILALLLLVRVAFWLEKRRRPRPATSR